MKIYAAATIYLIANLAEAKKASFSFPADRKSPMKFNQALERDLQAFRNSDWNLAKERAIPLHSTRSRVKACSSPLEAWIVEKVDEMGPERYEIIQSEYLDFLPYVFKRYIDRSEEDEYFGEFGEETSDVVASHEGAEMFFGKAENGHTLNTYDIKLLGMHGADLQYDENLLPTLKFVWGFQDGPLLWEYADSIQEFIENLPGDYGNVLLTANAIASPTEFDWRTGELYSDAIIMGDGLIQYLHDQNLGNYGVEMVVSHEFGHQMQHEIEADFSDARRAELMADALSAYYLGHSKGGGMEGEQIDEIHKTAFSVGDCFTASDDHHGTPAQRKCATAWGANVAASSQDESIMHPETFRDLFNRVLDLILVVDESVCSGGTTAEEEEEEEGDDEGCSTEDPTRYNICLDTKKTGEYTTDWTLDVAAAQRKWESVISGDFDGTSSLQDLPSEFACGSVPAEVDDLYICAKDPEIDGEGGVLGQASPVLVRTDTYLPISGIMSFDSADIQNMLDDGTWAEVVMHEIGHILGIGSLWDFNRDLVNSEPPYFYKRGTKACEKWREITGCADGSAYECPPVESDGGPGTAGGHWDELIMTNELMTGSVSGATYLPLSNITVGTLEDLGYEVNYAAADPYSLSCPSGRRALGDGEVRYLGGGAGQRRRLSAKGKNRAKKYGKKMLKKAKASKPRQTAEGTMFVADKFVSIFYWENGHVFSVDVNKHEKVLANDFAA